jgi:hypothetical protein
MGVSLIVGILSTLVFVGIATVPVFTFPYINSAPIPLYDNLMRILTSVCAVIATLLLLIVFLKKIPVGKMEGHREFYKLPY